MYTICKNLIRKLLPRKFLFRNEEFFRFFVYLFFIGNKFTCEICGKNIRKFISRNNKDLLCPRCGSLARNRRLWNTILELMNKDDNILDFSPSRCIYRKMRKTPYINYVSTDLSGDFIADKQYDITNINCENNQFDSIICYHILEHIEDDKRAMEELFRILKPGGICLIQTPFKEGNMYEDSNISSPEERTKHFGQQDHVRIYSISGLTERLTKAGFKVEIFSYREEKDNKFGYHEQENILLCRKTASS